MPVESNVERFSIVGRVFNSTTNVGLPNIVVTAYDVPDLPQGASPDNNELHKDAERLGSVVTDADGKISFFYGSDDIAALKRQKGRLNLVITLSAPDFEKTSGNERVIYLSSPPRSKAGKTETFNVGLAPSTLKKFGLDGGTDKRESLSEYKLERTLAREFAVGVADFHKPEIESDLEAKAALRENLINSIATNLDVATFPGEVIRGEDKINEKVRDVADRGVIAANNLINGVPGAAESAGVPVNLYLLPEDLVRLQPFFNAAVNDVAMIPEFELTEILARTNSSENPGTLLIHNNPVAAYCAGESADEKCARFHTGVSTAHSDHSGVDTGGTSGTTGSDDSPLTNDDVKSLAAKLISDMQSPGFVFGSDFNKPLATQEKIDKSVGDLVLGKGPADVPAFYDFVSLQIAFEHVWKVLVDEDIVNQAHGLDKKYRAKTGVGLIGATFNRNFADLLTNAGIYTVIPQEVPVNVAAEFDITLEEWIDLSAPYQSKLSEIATSLGGLDVFHTTRYVPEASAAVTVRDHRGTRTGMSAFQRETLRQNLRERGERIIDSVRHDDYYTLHKTLRDLQARINSNYEFTVFAADNNFHSVNFGLLNTYRQKWTPLNYQAGKLVKTIPLSPKEERKYSVKTTRNLKQARKEAIKNNSSQTSEQTSTSRVEAEIMEKAQAKTNFGLNTEGTYNIGISKGKSNTTFGVEAQNESHATRKDFREAVLKAVQEYKEERNIEVNTEDTSSYEYSESGSIVNPNDELSVTYLFYELQRRYRVSEQLYRVLPVVMVAQQVPAPHEITEAWVISNDWIINRFLLDDSFRPALQYLANKSVGDDFALRELRKNLRQQRNLAETLRIELSISSDEAENRYRALENAIKRRINEESDENTDGLFSDIGDFFGGGGQDPEAMKARELAAKDAHQYAVEKQAKAAAALKEEVNNLHSLTNEYNNTLRNHLDNETRCKRLLTHIRNNITYYLQAIWSMEPPDQRFLRLHKVDVPVLRLKTTTDPHTGKKVPDRTYSVNVNPNINPVADIFSNFRLPGTQKFRAFVKGNVEPPNSFAPLVEVADLDTLLGFKGNYMIFPMKEHNALTEFMAAPYVDEAFGAMDPNELSNVSLDDYARFICCLHETDPAEFDRLKDFLKGWLQLLLADPLRNGDEIVVPTGSLFIESLVGTYPLLENFKRRHREMDAYKVAEEVRKAQMENLRLAARLVNDEREDPDIEKKIVVQGNVNPNIDIDDV